MVKYIKNIEFYCGSNMSQIDWDRIVADADNEARKKVQKESENGQNSLDFISEPHVACCLLVDTSGSMQGSKIDELNRALQHFKKDVCADPLSAKRVDVCVVEFNSKASIVTPFCPIAKFKPPTLSAHSTTAMATGLRYAIEAVHDQVSRYHAAGIECYKPFVLMITDGEPTEDMEGIAKLISARESQGRYGHMRFHAFGVKGANMDFLSTLTHRVLAVNNNAFMEIFDWASKSMQIISHSKPTDNVLESNLGPNMEPYNPVEKKVPWND